MKLPLTFRPELLVEEDPGRYRTDCMLFVRECAPLGGNAALVATNRRALIILPVEADMGDVDGLVSVEALRFARGLLGDERDEKLHILLPSICHVHLRLLEKEIAVMDHTGLRATFPRPEGEFPRYEGVIPMPSAVGPTVSLSVNYLRDLADAAGENHISVALEGGDTAPRRVFQERSGAIGVLMPITKEQ